jgi:hypothetical protein
MSAGFEGQSAETAGLAAAKSAFGLVEGAFLPVPRLIGPAFLWLLAVFSFGAVAVERASPSERVFHHWLWTAAFLRSRLASRQSLRRHHLSFPRHR